MAAAPASWQGLRGAFSFQSSHKRTVITAAMMMLMVIVTLVMRMLMVMLKSKHPGHHEGDSVEIEGGHACNARDGHA